MRIHSKKLISLAVLLIMLINIFMPSISLALEDGKPEFTITSSKTDVKRGETVTVTVNVNLNGTGPVNGISPILCFDSSVLEPQKDTLKRLAPRYTGLDDTQIEMTSIVPNQDRIIMVWTYSADINYSGDLFSIDFLVKEDADLGKTVLSIPAEQDTIHKLDSNGNIQDMAFTVVAPDLNVIAPVEGISLDKTSLELWKGEEENLIATLNPVDTTQTNITWSSSDNGIATVVNGTVTAVSKGDATITATAENGKTASCNVVVKQPVEKITLNTNSLELDVGKTGTLTATVLPSNADGDKTVTWKTGNEAVATVKDGVVTAVGKGNTTITASVGVVSATCEVMVGVPLNNIYFEGQITEKTLNKGEQLELSVIYDPVDTDADKTVTWSVSDTSIVSIKSQESVNGTNDKIVLEALDDGNATITAKVAGKTITCNIRVEIPLESISIGNPSIVNNEVEIEPEQTINLQIKYNPEDATLDTDVIYSSKDISVATVRADGTIIGVAPGDTVIEAKTLGGKSVQCKVTVKEIPLEGISITEQGIVVNKGNSAELHVTYRPTNTTEAKDVVWSVNEEGKDVISIDENGVITALKAGTATVTATVGEKTATTTVTVKVPLEDIELNKQEVTLNRPETVDLDVILNPTDATIDDDTATWTSSDDSIATVDSNGVVTPHTSGTVYIKAVVAGKEASCTVTVKVPLERLSIKSETKLLKNQYEELTVELIPEDTTYEGEISWTSSDENIVTVENGKITALKEGTAVIKATAEENGVQITSNECVVTVEEIKIDSIAIDTVDFELGINRTKQLKVNFYPENTTDDKTITWTSSNPSIISVDENGVVKALKEGTAEITATVGEKTASVTVTSVVVPIESIEIVLPGDVNVGDSFDLVVKVTPEDATIQTGMIYSSSDENIISVDENGRLTVKRAGSVVLTVETENGIKEQVQVTVNEPNVVAGNEVENANGANTSNSPKTADIAVEMWIALLIISGLGITAIVIKNKRK